MKDTSFKYLRKQHKYFLCKQINFKYFVILLWCFWWAQDSRRWRAWHLLSSWHSVPLFHHIHLVINTHTQVQTKHTETNGIHKPLYISHPMSRLVCEWGIVGERQRCWRPLVQRFYLSVTLTPAQVQPQTSRTLALIEYCVFCSLCTTGTFNDTANITSPTFKSGQEIDLLCVGTLSAQVCV